MGMGLPPIHASDVLHALESPIFYDTFFDAEYFLYVNFLKI